MAGSLPSTGISAMPLGFLAVAPGSGRSTSLSMLWPRGPAKTPMPSTATGPATGSVVFGNSMPFMSAATGSPHTRITSLPPTICTRNSYIVCCSVTITSTKTLATLSSPPASIRLAPVWLPTLRSLSILVREASIFPLNTSLVKISWLAGFCTTSSAVTPGRSGWTIEVTTHTVSAGSPGPSALRGWRAIAWISRCSFSVSFSVAFCHVNGLPSGSVQRRLCDGNTAVRPSCLGPPAGNSARPGPPASGSSALNLGSPPASSGPAPSIRR
jgi:hypothetical protein